MLLVLAGLVSVPKYLYEAAAIDRVSAWRRFWSITFPYIRGLLMLALLFRTIEAFKLADLVILLTKGGNDTMLPEGYRQFSKVIACVEDRYRASLEVSELARIACLSESQFRKRFVKLFKIPPSKFINRIRVQTAAKLLLSSDDPIAEIALQCGFCDQSYFTRQFSSFFGLTPKRYRNRQGKRGTLD